MSLMRAHLSLRIDEMKKKVLWPWSAIVVAITIITAIIAIIIY